MVIAPQPRIPTYRNTGAKSRPGWLLRCWLVQKIRLDRLTIRPLYARSSISQARTTASQLIWTSRLTVGRLHGAVCPRTEQRKELLLRGTSAQSRYLVAAQRQGHRMVGAVAGSCRRRRNAGPNSGVRWSSRLGAAPSAENRPPCLIEQRCAGLPASTLCFGQATVYGDSALGKLVAVI